MDKKINENQKQASNKDYYTVDVLHILKTLQRRIWIISISGLATALIGFLVSTFLIAPTYSSHVMLYVNNSVSLGGDFSLSLSEINASQSLVKTYTEILMSRKTLEKVLEDTDLGDKYTYKDLQRMIKASSVNDTEIMRVTVTSTDPDEASAIANGISSVLRERIGEVIKGATMEEVDSAIPIYKRVAPSRTNYTLVGLLIGAFVSIAIIVIMAILDDTIHTEEHIVQNYDYPILARIPNLLGSDSKKYGYYYKTKSKK